MPLAIRPAFIRNVVAGRCSFRLDEEIKRASKVLAPYVDRDAKRALESRLSETKQYLCHWLNGCERNREAKPPAVRPNRLPKLALSVTHEEM